MKLFTKLLILVLVLSSIYSRLSFAQQTPPAVKQIFRVARADDDPVVKYKVNVQLAGEGEVGSTQILEKINGAWSEILTCDSSNSFESRTGGDLAFKTPAGRFQPLETSDRLLYQGTWDDHGPVTYYFALQMGDRRGFAAIHNGHIAGRNSHGCVRTTDRCAEKVFELANRVGRSVPGEISDIFSPLEERLGLKLNGEPLRAQSRRDFSAIVLNLLGY